MQSPSLNSLDLSMAKSMGYKWNESLDSVTVTVGTTPSRPNIDNNNYNYNYNDSNNRSSRSRSPTKKNRSNNHRNHHHHHSSPHKHKHKHETPVNDNDNSKPKQNKLSTNSLPQGPTLKEFQTLQKTVSTISRYFKTWVRIEAVKRGKSVVVIQRIWRGYICRLLILKKTLYWNKGVKSSRRSVDDKSMLGSISFVNKATESVIESSDKVNSDSRIMRRAGSVFTSMKGSEYFTSDDGLDLDLNDDDDRDGDGDEEFSENGAQQAPLPKSKPHPPTNPPPSQKTPQSQSQSQSNTRVVINTKLADLEKSTDATNATAILALRHTTQIQSDVTVVKGRLDFIEGRLNSIDNENDDHNDTCTSKECEGMPDGVVMKRLDGLDLRLDGFDQGMKSQINSLCLNERERFTDFTDRRLGDVDKTLTSIANVHVVKYNLYEEEIERMKSENNALKIRLDTTDRRLGDNEKIETENTTLKSRLESCESKYSSLELIVDKLLIEVYRLSSPPTTTTTTTTTSRNTSSAAEPEPATTGKSEDDNESLDGLKYNASDHDHDHYNDDHNDDDDDDDDDDDVSYYDHDNDNEVFTNVYNPPDPDQKEEENFKFKTDVLVLETTKQPPQTSRWVETVDSKSGLIYYYNEETKETKWTAPAGAVIVELGSESEEEEEEAK